MQRQLLAFGCLAFGSLACGRAPDPATALCAQVLERRLPGARVVASSASALEAELRFEVGGGWREEPTRGQLACAFEEGERGSLRLRGASLDGAAFTRAELTVVNADLWLADLRRAGARD